MRTLRRLISKFGSVPSSEGADSSTKTFSQQGEDLVLNCLFQWNSTGFYVDIGAHHPQRFSNTQLFYLKGWRGINIDPNPGIMDEFRRLRPGDINLEIGISARPQILTYHIFSEPAVNTFDEKIARRFEQDGRFRLLRRVEMPTRPLAQVLSEYLPADTTIDFMSVDVEGFDEEVLRSNDWVKYRPRVVIAEDLDAFTLAEVIDSSNARYLEEVGYTPIAKVVHSVFYCDKNRVRNAVDGLIGD